MSLISTTTPLSANATFNSGSFQIARAVYITGSVISDQAGTMFVEQSGDGTDWDVSTSLAITANNGTGFQETLVSPFFRIRYVNGSSNQATFRLYGDARDVYGTFLLSQSAPSSGGAYIVLYYDPVGQKYEVVNRFDGVDNYNVNEQAAVYTGVTGKYASCLVSLFVATEESVESTSNSSATSF